MWPCGLAAKWSSGGDRGLYLYNNGGHYNPSLDAWSYMGKGADRPEKRYGHTVVWTGTEMIIWGGYNGSDYLCTGGRYNPTTRFWQDVAPEQYLLSPVLSHRRVDRNRNDYLGRI